MFDLERANEILNSSEDMRGKLGEGRLVIDLGWPETKALIESSQSRVITEETDGEAWYASPKFPVRQINVNGTWTTIYKTDLCDDVGVGITDETVGLILRKGAIGGRFSKNGLGLITSFSDG